MLTNAETFDSVIIVAGNTNQANTIFQVLQLSLALPVTIKVSRCLMGMISEALPVELLLLPYGNACHNCTIMPELLKNKPKRIAYYNVPSDEIAVRFLQEGVYGVFYSDDPVDVISKGTRLILKNELWFKRVVTSSYIKSTGHSDLNFNQIDELHQLSSVLSHREIEVLSLLVSGYRNSDIAEKLFISLHTVKSHVRHILKKMGATNRTEIAAKVRKSYFNQ